MKYHIDTLPFSIAKKHPNHFDDQGVILSKIPYTQEYHYHTTAIASCAIVNQENKEIFDAQIKWLMNNITPDGAYLHDFSFPFYDDFPKPWVGGLCQGLAISALLSAYEKYDKKIYLDTAYKAFTCIKRDLYDNGCLFTDENGNVWIEEYPVKPMILNGFIYAVFGVYDLYKLTKDKQAEQLFFSCVKTLKENIPNYDISYWSLYDLIDGFPAIPFYHDVHVKQLHALYKITGENLFEKYHLKWKQAQGKRMNYFRMKQRRMILIVKKRGVINSIQRYNQRRRWKNG